MRDTSHVEKFYRCTGLLIFFIGLSLNQWSIGYLLSDFGTLYKSSRVGIAVFDIVCVLSGVMIIKYRSRITVRPFYVLMLTGVLAICVGILEVSARLFVRVWCDTPQVQPDSTLGWRPVSNVKLEFISKLTGNKVEYTTSKHGFRVYGDEKTDKTKVFILGDSFTHAIEISDGDTYYDFLRKHHDDMEFFVFGCIAYSSVQEYLILDKYIDMISPQLIIWQFHLNDLIDNSGELQPASRNLRPILLNDSGAIGMKKFSLSAEIIRSSYLLNGVRLLLTRRKTLITQLMSDPERYLKDTYTIMRMVRRRAGTIKIVGFIAGMPDENVTRIFQDICDKADIDLVAGLRSRLAASVKSGTPVILPGDPHWNREGHRIAGMVISEYLTNIK